MFAANLGSNKFEGVTVPILWGSRAIFEGAEPGTFRVIDLAAVPARVEIDESEPAPGIGFQPRLDGYGIRNDVEVVYTFAPATRTLRDPSGSLPDLEINEDFIRVDSNVLRGCQVSNFEVGLLVDSDGMALGAPIPDFLGRPTDS